MTKCVKIILIFCCVIQTSLNAQSKKEKSTGVDSIHVKGKTLFVMKDTSIYVNKDTVFYLPDSLIFELKKDREARTEAFYKNLKDSFSKRRLTKEIYSLLFKDLSKKKNIKTVEVPTNQFAEYENRTIRDIYIKRLQPFGTSVSDTTRNSKKWASKVSNSIHTLTRERVIRNNLLIDSGDKLDTEVIKDAERVLRRLPYLRDARVYVIPTENIEEVDILVVTRDIWNYSGSASYSSLEDFEVGFSHNNFAGLGIEIENEFPYDVREDPDLGYLGTYTVNSIGKSFISAELTFARSGPFDREGFKLFRNFITPETKYAGAIEVAEERRVQDRIFTDTTIRFDVRSRFQDYWFGRSYLLASEENSRTNLQIAVGFNNTDFLERPEISADTNQAFYDRRTAIVSLAIAKQRFQRSSLILGYGRTEDIPLGYLVDLLVGRELNQFYNRTYLGSIVSVGNYYEGFGFLRPSVLFGTFINGGNLEQGNLTLQLNYFSFLYKLRRTNFRQFIQLRFTRGINRFDNEFININNDNGVRGLSDTFLRGTRSAALNYELVAFTPTYFLGFRMAIYGYVDLAMVNNENQSLLDNDLYQGYGIGFRFRNENLAFNTLQVRLGWYPNTPAGVSPFDLEFSGEQSLEIPGFTIERPEVLPFR